MNLEENAIEILHLLCQNTGCVISDSGGKDSSIIKHIAMKAHEKYGLPFKIQHNHTTADAPETVYFIREEQKRYMAAGIEYNIIYPQESMWQLIIRHGTPPTRVMRYCCKELKEYNGAGEKLVTGVRKAESYNRKMYQGYVTFTKPNKNTKTKAGEVKGARATEKGGIIIYNLDNSDARQMVETCYRTTKTLINPILDWTDDFVWYYIRKENLNINPLYDCKHCTGRVGCIGCPMAGKGRIQELERYPKYKEAYIRAFEMMLKERERRGLTDKMGWSSGLKVYKWWIEDSTCDGQLGFDIDGNIHETYT